MSEEKRTRRRLAIAAAAATIGLIAIIGLSRPSPESSLYKVSERVVVSPPAARDPLLAELIRCRAEGDDAACQDAWDAHRRRFFSNRRGDRHDEEAPGEPAEPYVRPFAPGVVPPLAFSPPAPAADDREGD